MATIKRFFGENKACYLHASHVIVFLQRQVFDGIDFVTRASYQKFNGVNYLLPANPVNASALLHQALVPPHCEKLILDAVEETHEIYEGQAASQDKDLKVVQALLGLKAYNLFSVLREAMAQSLTKQISFLKEMRLCDKPLEAVYDQDTAYRYLNSKVEIFKKHNGGAEWVEVFPDPNLANVIAEQLKRGGFVFHSLITPKTRSDNIVEPIFGLRNI